MKRYRYGNPSPAGFLQKARPFILLIIGWNFVGIVGFQFVNSYMSKNDPAWETRPESERIAAITGSAPNDTVKYKYSLLGKTETKNESDS